MKLIEKTSFYYIGFSIIGFIIGGLIFYHIIFSIINDRTNEDLRTEKELIEEQILHSDNIPDFTPYFGHQIMVTIYDHDVNPVYKVRDTIITNLTTSEEIPYRYLISSENRESKSFSIEIYKPLINSNQLFKDIFFVMFIMFIFLLLSLILINYLISRKTWSTFYRTLKKIKEYEIHEENGLTFTKTNITEFAQLNEVLVQMSNKIYDNYVNLKEFTENASHEIQTPLAIIKSKLELLIQSQPLTSEQMGIVQSMYNAVTRLSKLNTNLVLLSKIENSQFQESTLVSINQLIESILINLEDLISQKEIIVQKNMPDIPVEIEINPALAEVLIINLISNAVKHNVSKGHVSIFLDNESLIVSNSGLPMDTDPEMMFNRFKKSKTTSESLGLGLSIVQKIAGLYHMNISYTYESEIHTLTLKFNK
jgi:signal transduction histidine kinase